MDTHNAWYGGSAWIIAVGLLFLVGCGHTRAPVSPEEAIEAQGRLGMAAFLQGRFRLAEEEWSRGLHIAREAGRPVDEARFLVRLSRASEGVGEYDAALSSAEAALDILGGEGDPALVGMALLQKGLAYRRKALYEPARPLFDQALAIARRLQNRRLKAESLRHIAALLQDQGRLDEALPYYQKALALARDEGFDMSEARSLNNLGLLFDAKADYAQALDMHRASLSLRREIGDRAGEGKVLGNICITFTKLNQFERALENCRAALDIAGDLGDQQRKANHLNNIGSLYRKMQKPRKALRYYRRSLKIKRKLSDAAGEARALNNIGETYWVLERLDRAEKYLRQSLKIKAEIGDLPGQSASLQNLALLHRQRGEYQKAKSFYLKAISYNTLAGQPELIWRAFDGLSYIYESLSRIDLAILFGKQAVRSIQETRDRMATLDKSLRRSYLDDKSRVYKHVADLLIRQGRLPEAQQVISLLKEEEYRHYINTREMDADASGDDVAINEAESEWLEQLSGLNGELGKIGYELQSLLAEESRRELNEEEEKRLSRLFDQAEAIRVAFDAFIVKMEEDFRKRGGASEKRFSEKALDYLAGLQNDLRKLQPSPVIVTYLVLADGIRIIVTTPSIQFPRRLLYPEADLNRKIFDFRTALTRPGEDPRPLAEALYDILISPVEQDLAQLEAETLMLSLDGTLRYLPFAALFDGERYLTEAYNLVLFNPAAKIPYGENAAEASKVAGIGMSEAVSGFSGLPGVVDELDRIVKEEGQDDPRGVLPGEVMLNQDFTSANFGRMLRKRDYQIIHLASHFAFRPGEAEDSFILLGDGGRLTMSELKSPRYPLDDIQLLTLSACETAVGSENSQGREVESFATLAVMHGAHAILATLWPVADASTAAFMGSFYELRNKTGLSKVEALRQAQLNFLHGTQEMDTTETIERGAAMAGDQGGFVPPPNAPYAHPYYWAPFILFGNFL